MGSSGCGSRLPAYYATNTTAISRLHVRLQAHARFRSLTIPTVHHRDNFYLINYVQLRRIRVQNPSNLRRNDSREFVKIEFGKKKKKENRERSEQRFIFKWEGSPPRFTPEIRLSINEIFLARAYLRADTDYRGISPRIFGTRIIS